MDIRKVKKLIELLEESNIDEIEIKEGEESVRISRNGAQALTMAARAAPAYAAPAPHPHRHRRHPQRPTSSRSPRAPAMHSIHPWWAHFIARHRPPLPRLSKWVRRSRLATLFASSRR